jgi:GNAT superfamily N-acetyltransferase
VIPTRGDAACLRPALPADAPQIAALFIASRRDALPYLPELHTDEDVRRWIPETVLRTSVVWVAELDDVVVGFVALRGDHVDHLYVLPGYYRQGIGGRLLAKAKALSPTRLRLFTFQRNERARTFYEARGFVAASLSDGSANEEREPDVLYEWIAPPSDGVRRGLGLPLAGPGGIAQAGRCVRIGVRGGRVPQIL